MKRAVMLLALIIFSMNLSLWVNGEFTDTQITETYPSLPGGLRDLNAGLDVNKGLVLLDTNSQAISSSTGGNFFTAVLDFLEAIPVLGSLITLFRFVFDFILNTVFGMTLLALKVQAPSNIVVFLGALNFGVVSIGLLEVVLDFTRARGGVR